MNTKKPIIILFIIILIAGNVLFGVLYFKQHTELVNMEKQVSAQQTNGKILAFAQLFVDKVLKGTGEIDFEDRLQLENSVRDINDAQVFDQWQKFVKSADDQDAQQQVAELFTLILNKITK